MGMYTLNLNFVLLLIRIVKKSLITSEYSHKQTIVTYRLSFLEGRENTLKRGMYDRIWTKNKANGKQETGTMTV